MHCNKCGSKDTQTVKCKNCKQTSSVKCTACGHEYCSDRYCEVIALHAKRKQLTQIAIVLFLAILCTVPSTLAVMTGAIQQAAGTAPQPAPEPPAVAQVPPPAAPPPAGEPGPAAQPAPPSTEPAVPPPPQGQTQAPPAEIEPPSPPAPPPPAELPPPVAPPAPIAQPVAPPPAIPPSPPASFEPPPSQQFTALENILSNAVGMPYKKDGMGPEDGGFDATGFVNWVLAKRAPVKHPEVGTDYASFAAAGAKVEGTDYKPGDILLFSIKKDGIPSFAGLYWKDGKFVYPFPRDKKVTTSELSIPFFAERLVEARRVVK